MHSLQFEQLCCSASEKLGLKHPSALGFGFGVWLRGVLLETVFVDGQEEFLLMADLGVIEPENKVRVYERLLAMQLISWDEPRMRFGVHPVRGTAVLCVEAGLDQKVDADELASLLESVTLRVAQWRKTQLSPYFGGLGHQS